MKKNSSLIKQYFKNLTTDTKNLLKGLAFSLRIHAMIAATIAISFLLVMVKKPSIVDSKENIPLILILFLCGMLGGVINNYFRINKLPITNLTTPLSIRERIINIVQIYVSLLISGALGLIFYAFIASGLITGTFFPEFKNLTSVYEGNFVDFFKDVSPKTNNDILKAMIWCFIAGFSEKLVPNTIDKLAKKSTFVIDEKIDELKASNKYLKEIIQKDA
jgi:hypothetical protein